MHEKIGVIDETILWHGSLNILSHNDTRESMLRIESPEIVREVMDGLGIECFAGQRPPSATPPELTEPEAEPRGSPACPQCGQPMIGYERSALWICSRSPQCDGTLPVSSADRAPSARVMESDQVLELSCPLCGTGMRVQAGIINRIVCPSSTCGFALDSRLSAGILSVLRRRGVL